MAKLRGITKEMLSSVDADIHEYEVSIKEGEQYRMANALLAENPDIVYFNYWDDEDEKYGGQLTYSINREDCLWVDKHESE